MPPTHTARPSAVPRARIAAAREKLPADRTGALAALAAVFRAGHAPEAPLDGRYRGTLITPSLNPIVDRFGRWLTARWLPWQGKTFDAQAHTGDNLFTNDGLPLAGWSSPSTGATCLTAAPRTARAAPAPWSSAPTPAPARSTPA